MISVVEYVFVSEGAAVSVESFISGPPVEDDIKPKSSETDFVAAGVAFFTVVFAILVAGRERR